MIDLSVTYRLKAAACEKLSLEAIDPAIKLAWAEIAIEWHALAFRITHASQDQILEIRNRISHAQYHDLFRVGPEPVLGPIQIVRDHTEKPPPPVDG